MPKLLAKYTIYGEPASKKNSKDAFVNPHSGTTIVKSSARFLRWENEAKTQLKLQFQKNGGAQITKDILTKMTFYKSYENRVDISNLYEGPQDLLTHIGIIEDDSLIRGHDDSRVHRLCGNCDKRLKFKRDCKNGKEGDYKDSCGKKKQCPYNRVDIEIYSYRKGKLPADMYTDRADMERDLHEEIQNNLNPPDKKFKF